MVVDSLDHQDQISACMKLATVHHSMWASWSKPQQELVTCDTEAPHHTTPHHMAMYSQTHAHHTTWHCAQCQGKDPPTDNARLTFNHFSPFEDSPNVVKHDPLHSLQFSGHMGQLGPRAVLTVALLNLLYLSAYVGGGR